MLDPIAFASAKPEGGRVLKYTVCVSSSKRKPDIQAFGNDGHQAYPFQVHTCSGDLEVPAKPLPLFNLCRYENMHQSIATLKHFTAELFSHIEVRCEEKHPKLVHCLLIWGFRSRTLRT
eukprot:748240-Amphidinium_carterae.1